MNNERVKAKIYASLNDGSYNVYVGYFEGTLEELKRLGKKYKTVIKRKYTGNFYEIVLTKGKGFKNAAS